jgi:hypothetical protein
MNFNARIGFFLLVLASAGCTTVSGLSAPDDYPRLTVDPNDSSLMVFVRPNVNYGQYQKIYVAPVIVQAIGEDSLKNVSDAEAQKIAAYTEKLLKDELGKQVQIVDKADEGVLSIHYRIIDLEPTSVAQVAMLLPPLSMINMLSPKGAFVGSITLSGQIFEGLDPQPSVAFMGVRSRPGIDAISAFGRWTAVETVIENSVEKLAKGLEKERKANL